MIHICYRLFKKFISALSIVIIFIGLLQLCWGFTREILLSSTNSASIWIPSWTVTDIFQVQFIETNLRSYMKHVLRTYSNRFRHIIPNGVHHHEVMGEVPINLPSYWPIPRKGIDWYHYYMSVFGIIQLGIKLAIAHAQNCSSTTELSTWCLSLYLLQPFGARLNMVFIISPLMTVLL